MQIKGLAAFARLWVLQRYVPSENSSNNLKNELNYTNDEFEKFRKIIKNNVSECLIR